MHRFFHSHTNIITKDDYLYKYISKVLRKSKNDIISLFDENQLEITYKIAKIDKQAIYLDKISIVENNFNIKYKINLYQAIIEKKDFERVIDFSTQAGVYAIYPIITEYSQKHFIYNDKLWDRFKKIAIEASQQCGRVSIPIIHDIIKLQDIYVDENAQNIVLHNKSNNFDLKIDKNKYINLFVGPEGGFSQKDILFLKNILKSQFFKLPTYILRSENSAGVAISLINFSF